VFWLHLPEDKDKVSIRVSRAAGSATLAPRGTPFLCDVG